VAGVDGLLGLPTSAGLAVARGSSVRSSDCDHRWDHSISHIRRKVQPGSPIRPEMTDPNDPKSHTEFVMSSISAAPPRLYPAPSPPGDLELAGLRGWMARRPIAGFLVIVLGLSWLLLSIPVLAFHGVIPGANLPVEVFALAATLLILLPPALWVTSITDGRTGVRVLFARVFRWRFGIGWWLVVLLACR